jgi:hypothetical protein
VLIDNAAHSFGFQVTNGVPMLPFYCDKRDREMIHVYYLLKRLASSNDVRPVLSNIFMLNNLMQSKISEQIEGVTEYSIQELSDDDLVLLENDIKVESVVVA